MTTRNPFAKDLPEMAQGLREQATSGTGADSGTELRPCDSEARDDLTAWALAVKDSTIAHLTADLAELRGSMQAADDRRSL